MNNANSQRYPAKIAVKGYAASELDITHEVLEQADWNYRLVAQWTGDHVVVFDAEHAAALADIACQWSNDIDADLNAGCHDDCPAIKRQHLAAMKGLCTLFQRLARLSVA